MRAYLQSRKSAQRGDKPLEFLILGEQVFLDLQGFVQNRLGVLEGVLRPLVRRRGLHILAHDDDRQQHQLKERLRDPLHDAPRPFLTADGRPNRAMAAKM